jgi:hypothetical protein
MSDKANTDKLHPKMIASIAIIKIVTISDVEKMRFARAVHARGFLYFFLKRI